MTYKRLFLKDHVAEWKNMYIRYSYLKKLIKNNTIFEKELLKDVNRVNDFYFQLEKEAIFQKNRLNKKLFSISNEEINQGNEKEISKGNEKDWIINEFESTNTEIKSDFLLNVDENLLKSEELILKSDENNLYLEKSKNCLDDFGLKENIKKEIPKKEIPKKEIPKKEILRKDNSRNNSSFFKFLSVTKHYDNHRKNHIMMEFIKFCKNVKSFQTINKVGILRLTKYCKNRETVRMINKSYILNSERLEKLLKTVKRVYRKKFDLNNQKVHKLFNKISKRKRPDATATFFAGVLMTISAVIGFNMKRSFLNPLFVVGNYIFFGFFLFGICLCIFDWKHINSEFIFGFELMTNLDTSRYFFLLSLFMFMHNILFLSGLVNAEIICFMQIFIFMLPIDFLYYKSRYYLIFTMFKIFTTPIFSVKFRHFFIADCMTSYSSLIYRIMNFYLTEEYVNLAFCISLIPSIIRFIQCIRRFRDTLKIDPHILNALKYLVGITYASISFYCNYNLKLISLKLIIGSIYVFYAIFWDFIYDWSLHNRKRMFPKYCYVLAIVYNVFGRSVGLINIEDIKKCLNIKEYLNIKDYLILIEIVRRFIWAIFRVEIEHLNNCDKLKTSKLVNISNPELFYRKDVQDKTGLESSTVNDEVTSEIRNSKNEKIYV
ncbi:Phosphate transporter PHO1 like protein 8 [Dictyocoela muelleri]|nr:Phosphate transporter PHO1 like protein 8 [Dictyocoela muelleri]